MKTLKNIKLWAGWIFYWLITQDERRRYYYGKRKGMYCYEIKDVSRIMAGSVTELSYDPKRKPVREYLNRKEYFELERTNQ